MKVPVLPSTAPAVLLKAFNTLSPERRAAFHEHLIGGTGSDYLSDWLRRAGAPVGATTIKRYRRNTEAA